MLPLVMACAYVCLSAFHALESSFEELSDGPLSSDGSLSTYAAATRQIPFYDWCQYY